MASCCGGCSTKQLWRPAAFPLLLLPVDKDQRGSTKGEMPPSPSRQRPRCVQAEANQRRFRSSPSLSSGPASSPHPSNNSPLLISVPRENGESPVQRKLEGFFPQGLLTGESEVCALASAPYVDAGDPAPPFPQGHKAVAGLLVPILQQRRKLAESLSSLE